MTENLPNIPLRDGSTVRDPRLGLIFERESSPVGLYSLLPADGIDLRTRPLISKRRVGAFGQRPHNQLNIGACAAFGSLTSIEREPHIHTFSDRAAFTLYDTVQEKDEFPGPTERNGGRGGTSILAILRELKRMGLIEGWAQAFTLEQVLIGLGYFGAPIFGMDWTRNMIYPGRDGIAEPTGESMGGHCVSGDWYDKDRGLIGGAQSWGENSNPCFAQNPHGWCMTTKGFEESFTAGGQCFFVIER